MYDTVRVEGLEGGKKYSVAVTPTRIPYLGFGSSTEGSVQNLVPRRVQYIVHAEKHSRNATDISSGTPCRIVSKVSDIKTELDVMLLVILIWYQVETEKMTLNLNILVMFR